MTDGVSSELVIGDVTGNAQWPIAIVDVYRYACLVDGTLCAYIL